MNMRDNVTILSFRSYSLYNFVFLKNVALDLWKTSLYYYYYCAVSSITDGSNFSILVKNFDFVESYNAVI